MNSYYLDDFLSYIHHSKGFFKIVRIRSKQPKEPKRSYHNLTYYGLGLTSGRR